jgi:hypothetical protein
MTLILNLNNAVEANYKTKATVKKKETLAFPRPINDVRLTLKNITNNLGLAALFIQLVMSKLFRES